MIVDYEDLVSGEDDLDLLGENYPAMSGKLRKALKRKRAEIRARRAQAKKERIKRRSLRKSIRAQRKAMKSKGMKFKARRKVLKGQRRQLRKMRRAAVKKRIKQFGKGALMFSPTGRKILAARAAGKAIKRRRALKKKPGLLRRIRPRMYRI